MKKTFSQDEVDKLKVLIKYPEYAVLEKILKLYLDELKDLTTIGLARVTIEKEVAGRIWAIKNLTSLFEEIGVLTYEQPEKGNVNFN